jgi:hypothetical protein
MAKKVPKGTLPVADFYLRVSDPVIHGKRVTMPKEKAFEKKKQKITFYNADPNPILVHFPAPLQPSKAQLRIEHFDSGHVTVEPLTDGEFVCRVEVLVSICPTCHSTLTGKRVLRFRPSSFDSAQSVACLCDAQDDDSDPIIKINP